MDALLLTNVSFKFDSSAALFFFRNLTLPFASNKIHFIRGKNGAGKSTLFRILQGNILSSEFASGTITLQGQTYDLSNHDDQRMLRKIIRMVPQKFDTMLADQFTFTQNLQLANLPRKPFLDPLPGTFLIPPLIDRFGINYTTPVNLLSGGQRQILAILMALQKQSNLLLLDEPTAALDEKNAEMVMKFLKELLATQHSLTILVICHDKDIVESYAQNDYHEIIVGEDKQRSVVTQTL